MDWLKLYPSLSPQQESEEDGPAQGSRQGQNMTDDAVSATTGSLGLQVNTSSQKAWDVIDGLQVFTVSSTALPKAPDKARR